LALSEPGALLLRHCQQTSRKKSAMEVGWLLSELHEHHGMNQAELALRLQKSVSWVSRRLALVTELPGKVQEIVREGWLCPHAAMKYLVPLARAKREHCESLAEGIRGERLSERQVRTLYLAWRAGDAEQRAKLVEHPLLYLKALEEAARADREVRANGDEEEQALLADLESLTGSCSRVRRRVREQVRTPAGFALTGTVRRAWAEAKMGFGSLASLLKEQGDAGHGYPGGHSPPSTGTPRDQDDSEGTGDLSQLGEEGAARRRQGGAQT